MTTFTMPYLGEMNVEYLQDFYSAKVDVLGSFLVNIYLDEKTIQKTIQIADLEKIKAVLENVHNYDSLNKAYFIKDFQTSHNVKHYLEHHLSEIPELKEYFTVNLGQEAEPIFQLFTKLHLYKVWFSVNEGQETIVFFDYTFNPNLTQYKLVIVRKLNGEFIRITMES